MLCFLLAAGVLLAGRLFYLQIVRGEKFFIMAEKNRIRSIPILAERGIIYDRARRPLVRNIPNFSLVIEPPRIPKNQEERERFFRVLEEGGFGKGVVSSCKPCPPRDRR